MRCNAQVHIKDAGDWTGALHAKFRASMQLTHSDKGAVIEDLKRSLARRLSTEVEHPIALEAVATLAKQVALILPIHLVHVLTEIDTQMPAQALV